jgi:outer membrane protein
MTRRNTGLSRQLRKCVASALCYFWPVSFTRAQVAFIEPVKPAAPVLWRPYVAPEVPPIRLGNSPRLRDLVRAGRLYLTVHDAITLALENNIDIELARYSPIDAEWRVTRAEAGGALPGVPSGASQTVSVASGQGVLGSQAAAGVPGGNNGTVRGTANASITQIGPVTQTLDPAFQEATTFSHRSLPQPNVTQSITPVLVQDQRIYFGSLQEGFLTGGSVNGTYNNHYLREDHTSDVLNPSSFPALNVFFEHSLLQGFGVAVNSRFITVAKINRQTSDLNFRTQVIGTVVNVLNAYYALVADYDDVKAKQAARDVAQTFYEDTRKRVELGALIELDVATAQSQLAASRQNLMNSQTALQQHEWQLKNLISRTGLADPLVASAHIVPLDRIVLPSNDDLPPLKEMVEMALANRSDLAAQKAGVRTSEVSALGTRNGVLPNLVAFASENQAGSAGTPSPVIVTPSPVIVMPPPVIETPDPYFVGGIGTALGQVFRRNFPSENAGAFFQAQVRNRQAQADYGIDQLQLRQQQLQTEKSLKQAQVDIMNAVVAMRQARARYDTAVQNRILQQQLFEGEQKKFTLGASTPYNVGLQQRDLAAAQSSEIGALVSYSNARVALDQATGRTLETNHISIAEARAGKVAQAASLPAVLPAN